VLQLHWTKLSWAKPNAAPPVWLRRRGYWFEALRTPTYVESAEENDQAAAAREAEALTAAAAAVVQHVREQLATGDGIRLTATEVANEGGPKVNGKRLKRDPIRQAIRHALAIGQLKQLELPKEERKGQRQTYLAPADYQPMQSGGANHEEGTHP